LQVRRLVRGEASNPKNGTPRPAAMTDVAQLAGVSKQTVSRVINGSPQVHPKTRERVLAAMEKLRYRPNSAARALATGRSRTIGVVSFGTTFYGPASAVAAIEQAADAAGYFVTNVSLGSRDRRSMSRAVERLRGQGVDGIVAIAPHDRAASALLAVSAEIPIVSIEATDPEGKIPTAVVDSRAGAVAATRHLLDLGHATVHHLAGPADWLAAQQRAAGWRDALRTRGARITAAPVGDWTARSGYELGRRLAGAADVTAIFVANDAMAVGLMRALNEAGRRIPDDVSVVGFDDMPEAAYLSPPLTTVRQDIEELGRRSVQMLVALVEDSKRPTVPGNLEPLLVLRASTAPPPKS
jgi:DNA-binding LacI/PurR family transcriptional regulator